MYGCRQVCYLSSSLTPIYRPVGPQPAREPEALLHQAKSFTSSKRNLTHHEDGNYRNLKKSNQNTFHSSSITLTQFRNKPQNLVHWFLITYTFISYQLFCHAVFPASVIALVSIFIVQLRLVLLSFLLFVLFPIHGHKNQTSGKTTEGAFSLTEYKIHFLFNSLKSILFFINV